MEFVEFHKICVPRSVVPPDCGDKDIPTGLFWEAAAEVQARKGYFTEEWAHGDYVNVAYIVKRALGPRVKEVIYVSDSMIALSWCSSLEKKLRLFVQNWVSTRVADPE